MSACIVSLEFIKNRQIFQQRKTLVGDKRSRCFRYPACHPCPRGKVMFYFLNLHVHHKVMERPVFHTVVTASPARRRGCNQLCQQARTDVKHQHEPPQIPCTQQNKNCWTSQARHRRQNVYKSTRVYMGSWKAPSPVLTSWMFKRNVKLHLTTHVNTLNLPLEITATYWI